MPMHTSDTRLSHLDCLVRSGWLSFDVTHMGEPDGFLLSPCCIHGYRAVWGSRPKIEWEIATTAGPSGQGSGYQSPWKTSDIEYFTKEQRMGKDGSWVLLAGASQEGDGPPIDAQAKWWVTSQSDADTIEEEFKGAGAEGTGGRYLGTYTRPDANHEEHHQAYQGPKTVNQGAACSVDPGRNRTYTVG